MIELKAPKLTKCHLRDNADAAELMRLLRRAHLLAIKMLASGANVAGGPRTLQAIADLTETYGAKVDGELPGGSFYADMGD